MAVQSHYFSVGPLVSWAEPGVGAVATQSVVEPAYGPRGLGQLPSRGIGARRAAPAAGGRRAGGGAPGRDRRQARARGGSHRRALHSRGRPPGGGRRSAQANMMERPTVPDAMIEAFRAGDGDLAARLLAALEAAEGEGGRHARAPVGGPGRCGAARDREPMEDRPVDLRVEDHPDPVAELRRLAGAARRPTRASSVGDELAARRRPRGSARRVRGGACRRSPDNIELAFWHGVALAGERPRARRRGRSSGRTRQATRAGASCCAACPRRACSRMIRVLIERAAWTPGRSQSSRGPGLSPLTCSTTGRGSSCRAAPAATASSPSGARRTCPRAARTAATAAAAATWRSSCDPSLRDLAALPARRRTSRRARGGHGEGANQHGATPGRARDARAARHRRARTPSAATAGT